MRIGLKYNLDTTSIRASRGGQWGIWILDTFKKYS